MRHTLVLVLVLLAAPVSAQQTYVNHFTGLPSWKAILFYPDPTFNTGANGPHDNTCQVKNEINSLPANLIVLDCVSVRNPTTGGWGTVLRLSHYSGHTNPRTYFKGGEMGWEGEMNAQGVPSRVAWYLWDFHRDETFMYYDSAASYPIISLLKPVWMAELHIGTNIHSNNYQAGPTYKNGYTGPGICASTTTVPTEYLGGICVVQ